MRRFFPVLLLCLSVIAAEPEKGVLPEQLVYGIPGPSDLRLDREGFSLGYSSQMRQAVWVCYILTAEELNMPKVGRCPRFRADPAVQYRPVQPADYNRTGFDRGHLAPAADMAYSIESMKHSFFMTNISPQLPGCNRGIWKRLETKIREWTVREGKLCIITGPVFKNGNYAKMGKKNIPVPHAFYKVVLDLTPPMKMIGFIIPNQTSQKNLRAFAVSVDEVEKVTGMDFFTGLEDELENRLEKEKDPAAWETTSGPKPPAWETTSGPKPSAPSKSE